MEIVIYVNELDIVQLKAHTIDLKRLILISSPIKETQEMEGDYARDIPITITIPDENKD